VSGTDSARVVPKMSETPAETAPQAKPVGKGGTEYVVGRAADLPEGGRLLVSIGNREIGIFKTAGKIHAILNRCPHRGGELCKGDLLGFIKSDRPGDFRLDASEKYISCPWHGWEYDIETGRSWYREPTGTKRQQRYRDARPFAVEIKSGGEVSEEIAAGAASPGVDGAEVVDAATHRIEGPYTAEVFPVEVEDEYIVLSLQPVSVLSGPVDGPSPRELARGEGG
jgi:nitrite reductase/ring-hydroxylating ferredoxin subunit